MEKDDYIKNIYIKNKKENDEQTLYINVEFDGGYYLNYKDIYPLKKLETEIYYIKQYNEKRKNENNKQNKNSIWVIIISQFFALYIPWLFIIFFWRVGVFLKYVAF